LVTTIRYNLSDGRAGAAGRERLMARRGKILTALMLALAVPATAQTFGLSLGTAPQGCLSIGNAAWRIAADQADVTVRIDPAAAAPDLRIALADKADEADFVFVDDGTAPTCPRGTVKTVKIDAAADLVVALAAPDTPADYRIYVRSRWLEPQVAAALFAAAQVPTRQLAGRVTDRSN
jgi:hypothetical protein